MAKNKGKAKISENGEKALGSCWYDGMNHQQLHLALAVPPLQFPHGPQQKKQKKSH